MIGRVPESGFEKLLLWGESEILRCSGVYNQVHTYLALFGVVVLTFQVSAIGAAAFCGSGGGGGVVFAREGPWRVASRSDRFAFSSSFVHPPSAGENECDCLGVFSLLCFIENRRWRTLNHASSTTGGCSEP